MQKLPVDLQSFEIIREEGFLYVDKTLYIHRMIEEGRYYFAARPRRFGKSLMMSTLKCLFQGRRDLFDGLWIAQNEHWDWQKYPIIQFDLNTVSHDTPEHFQQDLEISLDRIADSYEVDISHPMLKGKFHDLILALYRKTGKPVVVLIDGYDKPVTYHLGQGETALKVARTNRNILRNFLGMMKGGAVAPHIRFVFITGVSRFSRESVFSDLNNLIDITVTDRYAAMFGYTREELEHNFHAHILRLANRSNTNENAIYERLERHYGGYRFSHEPVRMYNPFSILRALCNLRFGNYWVETGATSFLVGLLRKRNYNLSAIEQVPVGELIFSVYDLARPDPEALLFQSGYLTICDTDDPLYILSYPNLEVRSSFLKHLLYSFIEDLDGTERSRFIRLSKQLLAEDFEAFVNTVNTIFAGIPYNMKIRRDENYFQTLFYLMVCASGNRTMSKMLDNQGRMDFMVRPGDKIFLMDFKCGQDPAEGLNIIEGYLGQYRAQGLPLFLISISFDLEKQQIVDHKIEPISS
ncbi:hypothetical protein DENIS_2318 [Desulfonema ishimotonii]|uniref:AAA-ATPase-like domain-containing protein n=1 Tax=Desulfonema ishimotonii TaxID=45657 RepID=A0A401FWL1_9BACT|nr:ATP-binding protein [Desulfonema ishimotonii]GBC61358.1 hypothetical protein DENIS_2318 [Desulfonema ishimotonii]